MSLPPDLRVLCRRLTSTKADDLPGLCPVLVSHVLRCGGPLSAPHEPKSKDKVSEALTLIHKLKVQINTMLNGRTASGRFTAVVLVKAIIDVGGWECLRISEPWVRGLLSVLQKPDSLTSKELCIITLVRIYTLLHGYQTLVREIATPTLPAFITACLQLIKPPPPGRPSRVPTAFTETVASALSALIPLYPTTLRPFSSQVRSTFKGFLAPTSSDHFAVPETLKNVSRRLTITIHHTAPKNGGGEEWAKGMGTAIKDCHATADWVFRAVQEYWESTTGYNPPTVSAESELHGGGDSPEELPSWTGLQAGAERLIGLLEFLADHFRFPTKSPVTVPVGELMDLILRLTLVNPPSSSSQGRHEDIQLNAAIGREEKDELWSVLPDIHMAALQLHYAVIQRLRKGVLSFASDILDQSVRVFNASRHVPDVREATYKLVREVLALTGPMLPKITVDSTNTIIQGCCRDLLQASGYLQEEKPEGTAGPATNGTKLKEGTNNADAFLNPQASSTQLQASLSTSHLVAAQALLVSFLTDLPQRHLSADSRGLIDRTAILSGNKAAMLASCLHPYKDKNGRYYPSILPFLVQQFPHDQEVEVLRANLRGISRGTQEAWEPPAALSDLLKEPDVEPLAAEEGEEDASNGQDDGEGEKAKGKATVGFDIPEDKMEVDPPIAAENAFLVKPTEPTVSKEETGPGSTHEESIPITLKRKASNIDSGSPKKLSKGKEPALSAVREPAKLPERKDDSDDDSDSGSIEIDATLSDDDDEEEEEDDDEEAED